MFYSQLSRINSGYFRMLKRHFSYNVWLTLFFVVFLFSCRKEYAGVSIPQEIVAERFFNEHRTNSTEEKQLIDYLNRLNAKKGFVNKTVERIGFPRWDKLVKYSFLSNSSGRVATNSTISSGGQDSATNYIIPFVRDTQNYVNAAMFIKIDKADTSINYLCDWQYTKYRALTSTALAEDMAVFFMCLDRQVNGYNKFTIVDTTIFRVRNSKTQIVQLKNIDSSSVRRDNFWSFQDLCVDIVSLGYSFCWQPGNCNPQNGYFGESCDRLTGCPVCQDLKVISTYSQRCFSSFLPGTLSGGVLPSPGSGFGNNQGGGGSNDGAPPSNDDGFRPGWKASQFGSGGFLKKPLLLDLDLMYSELNGQIIDKNVLNQYKLSFFAIEELYYEKAINPLNNDKYSRLTPEEFIELIKSDKQIALTIDPVTLLAKAGACGAADIIVQMFFARMLDDNIQTWSQALEKVDWSQVLITMATGVLPISNKYVVAAIAGGGVILQDLKTNGFTSWDNLGIKFVEGFMGSLIGTSLGDLVASKFGTLSNLGRKLVTKFEGIFPYGTICKWLGGGISNVSESLLTSRGLIASTKKMVGWGGLDKVAVIGRNMKERVIPFAEKMGAVFFDQSNPMAAPYYTKEVLEEVTDFNGRYGNNWPIDVILNSKLFNANQQFIRDLKKMGYTFVDLGGSAGSEFYDMEIKEIFK